MSRKVTFMARNENVQSIKLLADKIAPEVYNRLIELAETGRDVYAYIVKAPIGAVLNVWCINRKYEASTLTLIDIEREVARS